MNWNLKRRISELYGTQTDFARISKTAEAIVSKVVRERVELTKTEKQRWAKLLRCEPNEIFKEV